MAMSIAQGLDPDLLRSFVLIAEGRSFTDAAGLVGRTQSAVSMQVKRLEDPARPAAAAAAARAATRN